MKLFHFSSATTWRGGEQQIAYLVEELNKEGIQQWIFCPNNSALAEYCLFHNLPHFTYSKLFSINPLVAFQFKNLCKQLGVSLVHIHDSHSHTFAYMSALLGNHTPLVLSRRVDFPVQNNRLSKRKYNHPSIKRILSVSQAVQDILAPAIEDTSKLNIVHSGIDITKFDSGKKGTLRKELNLSTSTKIIANIAAIAPHKDYYTFVDAAAIIKRRHSDTLFLIIGGDGGEQANIEDYIQSKKLSDTIKLLGFRKDIPAILPDIDVLLYTSKEEGLGTTLLDVLACGVPIVATHAGGIPEIIQHQKNGLLAPIGDAQKLANGVSTILCEANLAKAYVTEGKERVKAFSKEVTARKTMAIYRQILNNNNP